MDRLHYIFEKYCINFYFKTNRFHFNYENKVKLHLKDLPNIFQPYGEEYNSL